MGGNFTTIKVPGATRTGASGINDSGQIVGGFSDGHGGHGFVDRKQRSTPPGAVAGQADQERGVVPIPTSEDGPSIRRESDGPPQATTAAPCFLRSHQIPRLARS
jgi:hypothetical protein